MTIQTRYPEKKAPLELPHNAEFTISYFEFPMIDNTRLENDMRLAVVLHFLDCNNNSGTSDQMASKRIEFKVIYFPGSRSSLKEKPYFDDIVSKLLLKNPS